MFIREGLTCNSVVKGESKEKEGSEIKRRYSILQSYAKSKKNIISISIA